MSEASDHIRAASIIMLRAAREVPEDPASVVRSWPRLTLAAIRLARALNDHTSMEARSIDQIGIDAFSMSRSNEHETWPGPGERNQVYLQATMALEAAAKSVKPETSREEATGLLNQTLNLLWVGSEYASKSARTAMRDVEFDRSLSETRRTVVGRRARDVARRIDAAELVASNYVAGTPRLDPGTPPERLHRAVVAWDVEAHRAMVQQSSTLVLYGVARMEAITSSAFGQFIDNAAQAGHLDPASANRMKPPLASLPQSWDAVAEAAQEFGWSTNALPRSFVETAETLRKEMDRAFDVATPSEQAAMTMAVKGHAASSLTVASSAQDLLSDQELRGPARAVARMMAEKFPKRIKAAVDPREIFHGSSIPLPPEIVGALRIPLYACVFDAHDLMKRTSALEGWTPPANPSSPTTKPAAPERELRPAANVQVGSPTR